MCLYIHDVCVYIYLSIHPSIQEGTDKYRYMMQTSSSTCTTTSTHSKELELYVHTSMDMDADGSVCHRGQSSSSLLLAKKQTN
jgi:hypothetical protein